MPPEAGPAGPRAILIAGPTASGKSALAVEIACAVGGEIVNADALQVYDCWQVLTARPDARQQAEVAHHLYGMVARRAPWSTGHWLRAVAPCLTAIRERGHHPIIVGGTGLYFRALIEGLADIPAIPQAVRQRSEALLAEGGAEALRSALRTRDPATLSGLDMDNPRRLQRAWEVLEATGRGLADWQAATPPPLLPLEATLPLLLMPSTDALAEAIAARFDAMLAAGALAEVEAALTDGWDPTLPSSQALGAAALVAHCRDGLALSEARERAIVATRQYAKRQRTWFRARMAAWQIVAQAPAARADLLAKITRRLTAE
ncbi:MAG: tRNA (adenosine(37)-N6)-dimethylallyltransferase MiaA [Pseudomonadota bacterium]